MNLALLVLSLISVSQVVCEDAEYGCNDDCECSDITDLFSDRNAVLYSEDAGCTRNVTCPIHFYTKIQSTWDRTDYPRPSDAVIDQFLMLTTHTGKYNDPPGAAIDLFSNFGIVCENNEWYVTKYPEGMDYPGNNMEEISIPSEELNGIKTKIWKIDCKSFD